jgi:hypothetical protein
MRTLDEIAIECGTDKSSRGHSYCQYYDIFFDQLRYKSINLLEIGIDKGDSLRMWHKYFPHSEIHGIDLRGDYEYLHELGIKTHIVDHSNRGELIVFGEQYDQHFDIIIEDGSHMSEDSVLTFETLFRYLKPGGNYVIEDMLCDYDSRWNSGRSSIERVKRMVSEVNMSDGISHDNLCSNKKEAVKKYGGTYFDLKIESIFVSCGLCIIKKM